MKTMNKTLAWLVAAVLTISLVTQADAQSSKQRTGKVVRIKGDARYTTSSVNKVWQPLKVGAIIKSGNIVQTAKDSFVDIILNEEASAAAISLKPMPTSAAPSASSSAGGGGSSMPSPDQDVVRVLDDSTLVFDSLTAVSTGADTVTESLLDLKRGSIFGSVKKQAAASRFEVKIPNGVAGIRGTIFMINASGKVSCFTGSVIAAYTDSSGGVNTHPVGAGSMFDINTGESSPLNAAMSRFFQMLIAQCNYAPGGGGHNGPGGHGGPHNPGDHPVSNNRP